MQDCVLLDMVDGLNILFIRYLLFQVCSFELDDAGLVFLYPSKDIVEGEVYVLL